MVNAQRDGSDEGILGDGDAQADSLLLEVVDRMLLLGWQRQQALDAIRRAASRLDQSRSDHRDGVDHDRPSSAGEAVDEPSNDWPSE